MLKLYLLERMSLESRSNTYTKIPCIDIFSLLEKMKKNNTPLLKQFQSPIEKSQIEAKVKSLEQNKYMIAHFPGYH
jgi:hypothetical protein